MREYLDHYFPVILHSARPQGLDGELEKRLNKFLPLFRDSFKKVVLSKGRDLRKYKFLRPHHLVVILLPSKLVLAVDTTNANLFMTCFFCFKLDSDVDTNSLSRILNNIFFLNNCFFYEFDINILEDEYPEKEKVIYEKALEYEELEYQLIRKEEGLLEIKPKIFKNTDIPVKENYCFVLMPFCEDLREIYEECITVAVKKCGMVCERADDIFHNTSIMEVIWTKICSAEIIIADLTGKNPNVFYEVGIAHTLGKEVILITQNDEDVPFDLRHIRYIKYGVTKRGQIALVKELEMTIKSIKGMLENIDSHSQRNS